MKSTAVACSNIAFVKFFGKKDEDLRLPMNGSISMNLSGAQTTTTVEFSPEIDTDEINMISTDMSDDEKKRIIKHLDRIREKAKSRLKARVATKSNFPKASGIASSASGFAALTLAGTKALGLDISEKELSILARLGSGSACRSIPEGFVEWKEGETSENSYAHSIHPPSYWNLADIVSIVDRSEKPISTTQAHGLACSSPFLSARFSGMNEKTAECKKFLKARDFDKLGELIEAEAFNMHAVMMTAVPSIFYFRPGTVRVMREVWDMRKKGIPVYFTIDAGPNVHVICESNTESRVLASLKLLQEIKEIIINHPGEGACLTDKHLF